MRPKQVLRVPMLLMAALCLALPSPAQQAAPAGPPVNLTLRVVESPLSVEALLNPSAEAWNRITAERIALNRTPPLYETDPPAGLEIPVMEVRLARSEGKLVVYLTWRDRTRDAAALAAIPETAPEQRDRKELTQGTERFFDAAAVMFPANPSGVATPSLQMGDAAQPVAIHYWNSARGAMLMEAQGRTTTRRTGETFPAQGLYRNGAWQVTFELPELAKGVPLAFAVWNGSQMDRDGRKYFSVWHWLE